jgi:hypothetical protein
MKQLVKIVLLAVLSAIGKAKAQIQYQPITGGVRLPPVQTISPCVTITPDGPVDCNAQCGTPDLSETEYQALPWFGKPEYLDRVYDSLNTIYGSANVRGEDDIERPWLRVPVQFWMYRGGVARENQLRLEGYPLPDVQANQRLCCLS